MFAHALADVCESYVQNHRGGIWSLLQLPKELRLLKEASENESSTSVSAVCDTQILRLTQLLEG